MGQRETSGARAQDEVGSTVCWSRLSHWVKIILCFPRSAPKELNSAENEWRYDGARVAQLACWRCSPSSLIGFVFRVLAFAA